MLRLTSCIADRRSEAIGAHRPGGEYAPARGRHGGAASVRRVDARGRSGKCRRREVARHPAGLSQTGLVGSLYGRYVAFQSAVADPTVFKAAIAIVPVTDLIEPEEERRRRSNAPVWHDLATLKHLDDCLADSQARRDAAEGRGVPTPGASALRRSLVVEDDRYDPRRQLSARDLGRRDRIEGEVRGAVGIDLLDVARLDLATRYGSARIELQRRPSAAR